MRSTTRAEPGRAARLAHALLARARLTDARVAIALVAGVLAAAGAWAATPPDVRFTGISDGRAALVVDGAPVVLAPGERGPGGMRVVALDARSAWLREGGRTWVLAVGRAPVPLAGEVSLARGRDGRYRTEVEVDGHAMAGEVDALAPRVLLPAPLARRAGLAFDRRAGRRISVRGRDVLAFPVRLRRVAIGAVAVRDVPALVVEDRRVDRLVLGGPFLARFDTVASEDGALLLGIRR